jgi:glutaredoxin-related protein
MKIKKLFEDNKKGVYNTKEFYPEHKKIIEMEKKLKITTNPEIRKNIKEYILWLKNPTAYHKRSK